MCVYVCASVKILMYHTFTTSVSQDSSQQIQAQVTRTGSRAKTGGE